MNEAAKFLTTPAGVLIIGVTTSFLGSVMFNLYQRRKDAARAAAERLRAMREQRLTAPSPDVADMAHVLAILRAYAFIVRLDVLVNRRLIWAFAILIVETISFAANGAPAGALAWAMYLTTTGVAVAFMVSAFAMTRRATAEYRSLTSTGSLQEDEITRLPDFRLP